jgi:hypothetical protein
MRFDVMGLWTAKRARLFPAAFADHDNKADFHKYLGSSSRADSHVRAVPMFSANLFNSNKSD